MDAYRRALSRIHARSDYGRGFVSDPFWGDEAARLGLRRMAALLERLGRPDRRYPIIHVAGSKGKGSTCAFAASVLSAAGCRVGLTTSPHLHSFRERIAIGGEMISEAAFAVLAERVTGEAEALEAAWPALGRVTAFELLTAMALDRFAASECDVAVVEVGMGGTLDSTNVITPTVSVITALDYEHTTVLGETLTEIATNKAGIIKPGHPVVVAEQRPDALAVIMDVASRQGSSVWVAGRDWQVDGDWRSFSASGPWGSFTNLGLLMAGNHQLTNAGLALAVVETVRRHSAILGGINQERLVAAVREGLARASLPGRFEVVETGGRTVVLDGAHSPASARMLAAALREAYPGRPAVMVVGMAADKRIGEIAGALLGEDRCVVATRARTRRAAETGELARAFQRLGASVCEVPRVSDALSEAAAIASEQAVIVVTGSFGVIAEAREALRLAKADPIPA
jgi:dihydrofolate synthase/folylpolyglutamate synthase